MPIRNRIAVTVIVIAGTVAVLWFLLPEHRDASPEPRAADQIPLPEDRTSPPPEGNESAASGLEKEKIDPPAEDGTTPPPGNVTWIGTLYDSSGRPVEDAKIKAEGRLNNESSGRSVDSHESWSYPRGRFSFRGLFPGRYRITIEFAEFPSLIALDEEVFLEKPGRVDRDLHIPPHAMATVSGVVIDEHTGRPLQGQRAWIGLYSNRMTGNSPSREVDHDNGTFLFSCIPPGIYDLMISGPGRSYLRWYPDLVKAEGGKNVDDLRIVVPPHGELLLVMSGFSEEEMKKLKISCCHGQDRARKESIRWRELNWAIPYQAGEIEIEVSHQTLGKTSRRVVIVPGKASEVVIFRDDLLNLGESSITLTGSLSLANGSPAAGAVLIFRPRQSRSRICAIDVTADSSGGFTIDRMEPGIWDISYRTDPQGAAALSSSGGTNRSHFRSAGSAPFRGIKIPDDPSGIFHIDLLIPAGSVRGRLCDSLTGGPLRNDSSESWGGLIEEGNHLERVCRITWNGSDPFEITGIRDGRFVFAATIPGYRSYLSRPFTVAGGVAIDLGEIPLEPSGVIDLEVFDQEGRSINNFKAYVNGEKLSEIHRRRLPSGTDRYWEIPYGTVTLEVTARGFKTRKIPLRLAPARPLEVRVKMEPDS